MGSKTKIIVLRMKEIIYTGVFIALGLLLVILLIAMFSPKRPHKTPGTDKQYIPGIYTSTAHIGESELEVEVSVDESHINSVRFSNLDESTKENYPLLAPVMEKLARQIYEKQSLQDIEPPTDTPYTSKVLLESIEKALEKATPETPPDT